MDIIRRVAVVEWWPGDEIAKAIVVELTKLGLETVPFPFDGAIPNNVDMVLTFAPYDKLLPIASQMAQFSLQERPIFVHWQTQNLPNPSIPWMITKQIAWFRSWIDRLSDSPRLSDRFLTNILPIRRLRQRMYRFRYLGDILYAYLKGWLDILVHSSNIYIQHDIAHGIPAIYVPWGTSQNWYADLHLKRDIDVLWFGKRRIRHRSKLLDAIRRELRTHGIEMYVIDGVEKPFVHGEERTQLLNRSKIALNLRIYPYDNVYPYRFQIAAGNKCMLVCEPEWNHHPQCIPGKHFIAAETDKIVEKILYYLDHDNERSQITENAYRLVTQKLTMANSLKTILLAAENKRAVGLFQGNSSATYTQH